LAAPPPAADDAVGKRARGARAPRAPMLHVCRSARREYLALRRPFPCLQLLCLSTALSRLPAQF
jgi:hypothetical protein